MRTLKNNRVWVMLGVLVACLSAVCLSTSPQGGERRYEIRPEITIPESKTDTARMIDAYERLMDDYRRLLASDLAGLGAEVKALGDKLSVLSAQVESIQRKLGIEPTPPHPQKPMAAKDPNGADEAGAKTGNHRL